MRIGVIETSLVLAACVVAGCQGAPQQQAEARPAAAETIVAMAAPAPDFAEWLAGVRDEAGRRGIRRDTLDAALVSAAPIPRVIELDRSQPEFTQTFWRYFDAAVSPQRISDASVRFLEHDALLTRIEKQYGVQKRFLVSFWGLESNFGRVLGSYPVVSALATLAHDGRRSA